MVEDMLLLLLDGINTPLYDERTELDMLLGERKKKKKKKGTVAVLLLLMVGG